MARLSSPTTVATYDYLGAGHLVGTTLDQANLNTSVFAESGGTHTYSDLDRFNRPTRWNWERVGGASGGFYNTAIAYDENSNPTRTLDAAHVRNSDSRHRFDVLYTLDGLNRVISADEGNIASGAIESGTRTRKELWNSLSLTGNWGNRQLDSNGDGDFGDEPDRDEPSAYNTFNKANEWTARRVAKAGGSDRDEHAYTYDAVGNLTDLAATAYRGGNTALTHRRLVYDAFGRLVRVAAVEGMDETDVALYRYNGLNMRLMWQDDADADSTLESSERFYVMHDERWRPVATFRDTDTTLKEAFVWHAAGLFGGAGFQPAVDAGAFSGAGFQPASYIDSVILRDRDNYTGGTPNGMTSASDGTLEERRVFCQNWRADVVAITKADGTPLEYVRYSPYGEPTVYPIADLNMDGVVNSTDSGLWSDLLYSTSNSSVYADTDLDWDGADDWNSSGIDSDLFYESYNANTGLSGVGRVSSPGVGNRTGYAGYQWDQTISAYHVRYRVYLPDIGRWTRRDPINWAWPGLYCMVYGATIAYVDPDGLMETAAAVSLPPELTPGFVGPPRPGLGILERTYKGCPAEPTGFGDPGAFWRMIARPAEPGKKLTWWGVTYCENGQARSCYRWAAMRLALNPQPNDASQAENSWWQMSDTTRRRILDFAYGLVAACVIRHEELHASDADCDGTRGLAMITRFRSGSLADSERDGYGAERTCLLAAYQACGESRLCQKVVERAMQSWNTTAATPQGAKNCGLSEPLPPIEVPEEVP